jgi:SAM-dependent methyltransferase
MNVADKAGLFAEVRRVLRPGGLFGVYDVMREGGEGDLSFPVPWAASPETSFVESAARYPRLLEGAGFATEWERSSRAFAVEFFRTMRAQAAQGGGPPPLDLHILMDATAPRKVPNMIDNLERG